MFMKIRSCLLFGSSIKQLISSRVVCSNYVFRYGHGACVGETQSTPNVHQHCICRYSNYSTCSESMPDKTKSSLKLRYIYVHTSQERWTEIPQGLIFDVAYLDSHPGLDYNPNTPLIVALHDSPGSHEQLQIILEPLARLGYRVIAPTFPGYGFTAGITPAHDDIFLHSTDERAQFVTDFLSELGIKKVDVLVGYRAGCYPCVRLCTGNIALTKSLVLICPAGHRPYRGIQPVELYRQLSALWDRPFLRPIMKLFLFYIRYNNPLFKREPFNHMVPMLHTVATVGFEEFGGFLVTLSRLKLACCMMYSTNDSQIETEVSEEYADLLGLTSSDFMQIDEGKIVKSDEEAAFQKGIVFKDDGNDLLMHQTGHIVKIIWDLVKFVRKKS